MALVAALVGMIELVRVPEGAALRIAYWHMGAMMLSLTCYSTRLLIGLDKLHPLPPNSLSLVLDVAGFVALTFGGWMGGQLVYGFGVGRQ